MRGFLDLPAELIEMVGDASNTQGDLLALSQTCRGCYSILNPRLIPYNIRNNQSSGFRQAARLNDLDLARQFLCRNGVDVNSKVTHRDGTFETPLLIAMEHSNEDMILLLLDHGADPGTGVREYSPGIFFEACATGKLQVMRKLVEMGCVTDFRRFPLSHFTVTSLPMLEILLECFDAQDPSPDGEQLFQMLFDAASDGAVDIVQALLARGVPANPSGPLVSASRAPLYGAILGESPEVANILLQNGADLCYDMQDLRRICNDFWPCWALRLDNERKRRRHEMLELLRVAAASVPDRTDRAVVREMIQSLKV